MRPLPIKLPPYIGESAQGAFVRLSNANGYLSWHSLRYALGWSETEILSGAKAADTEQLAGIPEGTTKPWTATGPTLDGSGIILNNQQISLRSLMLRQRIRRCCTLCIGMDQEAASKLGQHCDRYIWHRSYWDIAAITGCAIHQVELVSACPKCERPLSWREPSLSQCPVGCDLGQFSGQSWQDPLSLYLLGRFNLGKQITNVVLDVLTVRDALALCTILGKMGQQSRPLKSVEVVPLQQKGFLSTINWPHNLHIQLEALHLETEPTRRGITGSYGRLYDRIQSRKTDFPMVCEAIRDHAIKRRVISQNDDVLGLGCSEEMLSIKDIVSRMHVSSAKVRRILSQDIEVDKTIRRGVRAKIDRSIIYKIQSEMNNRALGNRSIGTILGVGRGCARDLRNMNLLPAQGQLVTFADVAAFKLKVTEKCTLKIVPEMITVRSSAKSHNERYSKIIRLILEGNILAGINPKSSGNCMVDDIFIYPRLHDISDNDCITLVNAAKTIGIHSQCLGELVQRGIILRKTKYGLYKPSLQEFENEFVPANRLSKAITTGPRYLIQHLTAEGVHASFGPPKFRQTIYLRRTLLRAEQSIVQRFGNRWATYCTLRETITIA